MNGVMRHTTEGVHQSDVLDPDHDDLEMFGVDPEQKQVLIPDTLCPLTDTERQPMPLDRQPMPLDRH